MIINFTKKTLKTVKLTHNYGYGSARTITDDDFELGIKLLEKDVMNPTIIEVVRNYFNGHIHTCYQICVSLQERRYKL